MKLLGIASFFLALLCVCTVGGNDFSTSTASTTISSSIAKSVTEAVVVATSQTTTSRAPVLTTTVVSATTIESITSNSMLSSPNAVQQTTQSATTQPPVKVTTTAANRNDSTTNPTQESGTHLTQNGSLDASSTKTWTFSSTISLQKTTSAPGTSSLHMSFLTESTTSGSPGSSPESSPGSSPGNKKVSESAIHYSTVILPVVITLIVITLSVFSLVALYRMCQKKTPEGQENGTEQAQSDKEGVKLLSVKTTSPETVFVEVRDIYEVGFSLPSANLYEPTALPPSGEVSQSRTTGEHSSQGKNKTRQLFSPQQ